MANAVEVLSYIPVRDCVVDLLGRMGVCNLRLTCKTLSQVFPAPYRAEDASDLLLIATKNDDILSAKYAIQHGGEFYEKMLNIAAGIGSWPLCELALHKMKGITSYMLSSAVKNAAKGRHAAIVGRLQHHGGRNFMLAHCALVQAGRTGDVAYCQEIIQQTNPHDFAYEGLLYGGARAGSREICELARSKGAKMFDAMLYGSALGGQEDICKLAISWGGRSGKQFVSGAARGGHAELCRKAIAHFPETSVNEMLFGASRGGHVDLCNTAIEMGADDMRFMLFGALIGRHKELFVRAWVALGKPRHARFPDTYTFAGIGGDLSEEIINCGYTHDDAEFCMLSHELFAPLDKALVNPMLYTALLDKDKKMVRAAVQMGADASHVNLECPTGIIVSNTMISFYKRCSAPD